jgi:hypothetical protein
MNHVLAARIIVDTVVMMCVHVGRTNGWDGNTTAEWCAGMEFAEKLVAMFLPDADRVFVLQAELAIEQYLHDRITDEMAEVAVFILVL